MARDLRSDQQLLAQVLALAQRRRIEEAAALAEGALAEGFEHPLLLNVVATRLEQQGNPEGALRLLERAVALAPHDIGARNALCIVLQRVGKPALALTHAEELLRRNPDLGFAHANKGNALIAMGALSRAAQSHLRALQIDPANFVSAAALASIATRRGDHGQARPYAERALAAAPGYPEPIMSLAAADLAEGKIESAENRLRDLLADTRVAPLDRARAHGQLGDVHDAAQRYPQAFAAYAECNDLLRTLHGEFGRGRSVTEYARGLAGALNAFSGNPPCSARPAPASPAAGHVFLLGFPRSGTTLLEVVLDGHDRVVSAEEHELLIDGVLRYMGEPVDLSDLAGAAAQELNALRDSYWQRVRAADIDVSGKVFVDKYPLNTLKLPLIAQLFPHAKILFARRDPRDVVLSCFRRRFAMNAAMYEMLTLAGGARLYDAVMSVASAAKAVLGIEWHTVRHESLLEDFEGHTRTICEFIGLEWRNNLADFSARVRSRDHATPSTAQLTAGLSQAGIGHWRHYAQPLAPVLPSLAPWIESGGYAP